MSKNFYLGNLKVQSHQVSQDGTEKLLLELQDGEVIETGANTLKNSTGYNLTQLMVGSEGTLGIITKIVLKLLPINKHNVLLLVPFYKAEQACEAVSAIFRAGIVPSWLDELKKGWLDSQNLDL